MQSKRILCVEDDEDTRDMLTIMLGYSDLESVGAPNVVVALQMMEHERFDLYILDGGHRSFHGTSLCKQIRNSDARTPIVIFSGHVSASDIEEGIHAGANAYLVKPDSSELIPTIRRLLEAAA